MTDQDRIREIEALVAAATAGPWELDPRGSPPWEWGVLSRHGEEIAVVHALLNEGAPNAAFIAHAREDMPWLLARVKALTEAVEAVEWVWVVDRTKDDSWEECAWCHVQRTTFGSAGHARDCARQKALRPGVLPL